MTQSSRVSPWLVGSLIASGVVAYTTFQKIVTVPVVSGYVGGDLFEITKYVSGLSTQFSPWLDQMMNEATGATTATLLTVGSKALVVAEVIAIAALLALAIHLVSAFMRRGSLARRFGLWGFSLALVVPVVFVGVVQFVAWQMSNALTSIDVLDLTAAPVAQAAAAILGLVCVVMATRREPKQETAQTTAG